MADTLVEGAVSSSLDSRNALWGPYWATESIGVIIYVDSSLDVRMTRTINKGVSWTDTVVSLSGGAFQLACWYDKETPGNSGVLVHMVYINGDIPGGGFYGITYRTVDVSNGSLGTERTVDAGVTVDPSTVGNRVAITQTVSGNLIVAFSTQTEVECYKSADSFATAGTKMDDVFETATAEDWCLLFPAATADDSDVAALFWDRSANVLSLKVYDDSGDTWTEKAIASSMYDATDHINMDGTVRHSDSRICYVAHTNDDYSLDDLITGELTVDDPDAANCTVTSKTNIFTDQGESAQVSILINQQNDDVYVVYLKGGVWESTVDVVYHISTDGMTSWGVEQSYSQATDDIRLVSSGRTVGDSGGRYQPAFYNDDTTAIYINEELDIELGVGAVEGQAAFSGEGSLAAAGTLIAAGSAAFSGVGSMAAIGTLGETETGEVVMSGVGSMGVAAVVTHAGKVSFEGVGSLAIVGGRIVPGVVAMSGVGSMSVIGEVGIEGRASMAGVGSMSVIAERIVHGQVSMVGVGSMGVVGVATVIGVVSLTGEGSMSAIGESGLVMYTQMGKRTFDFSASEYPAGALFYLEANMETEGPNGTAYVRLFNMTDAVEVDGSPIEVPGPGPTWKRSVSFPLSADVKRYRIEYGGVEGGVYTPHGAVVRVESS